MPRHSASSAGPNQIGCVVCCLTPCPIYTAACMQAAAWLAPAGRGCAGIAVEVLSGLVGAPHQPGERVLGNIPGSGLSMLGTATGPSQIGNRFMKAWCTKGSTKGAPRLILVLLAQCDRALWTDHHVVHTLWCVPKLCRDWVDIMLLCWQSTSGEGFSAVSIRE